MFQYFPRALEDTIPQREKRLNFAKKAYHAKKVDTIEISDSDTEDIIRAAISKVKPQ